MTIVAAEQTVLAVLNFEKDQHLIALLRANAQQQQLRAQAALTETKACVAPRLSEPLSFRPGEPINCLTLVFRCASAVPKQDSQIELRLSVALFSSFAKPFYCFTLVFGLCRAKQIPRLNCVALFSSFAKPFYCFISFSLCLCRAQTGFPD